MSPKYIVGKTLRELGFGPSGDAEIAVLALQRGKTLTINPASEERVEVGDALVLCGSDDNLETLLEKARQELPEENNGAEG